jgi:hypothetical protein
MATREGYQTIPEGWIGREANGKTSLLPQRAICKTSPARRKTGKRVLPVKTPSDFRTCLRTMAILVGRGQLSRATARKRLLEALIAMARGETYVYRLRDRELEALRDGGTGFSAATLVAGLLRRFERIYPSLLRRTRPVVDAALNPSTTEVVPAPVVARPIEPEAVDATMRLLERGIRLGLV